jgi:hypothetical protein
VFYLGEAGKPVYQQLKESSGVPELDAAALNAVRPAAPYPPVPFGHSHVLVRDSAGEAAYAHLGASRTTEAVDHGKAPSQQPTLTPAGTEPPVLPARRCIMR